MLTNEREKITQDYGLTGAELLPLAALPREDEKRKLLPLRRATGLLLPARLWELPPRKEPGAPLSVLKIHQVDEKTQEGNRRPNDKKAIVSIFTNPSNKVNNVYMRPDEQRFSPLHLFKVWGETPLKANAEEQCLIGF